MSEPRLTIGIPTLDRAEYLQRAIDSCLRQTVPAKILVCDQGGTDAIARIMDGYKDHPLVTHVRSHAATLWQNWRHAAHSADTEFFAWLQDDDIIAANYTRRIVDAFDRHTNAHAWIARLAVAVNETTAIWFAPNGPMIPFDLLKGTPVEVKGNLFQPLMYFTSFAMSPAVAFRCGDVFDDALDRCPDHCDLFTERAILAAVGLKSSIVCDPVLAGYWIQHGKNESRAQHKHQADQTRRMLKWADDAMDEAEGWEKTYGEWITMMPVGNLTGFLLTLSDPIMDESRHIKRLREMMLENIKANVPDAVPPAREPVTLRGWWQTTKRLVGVS